MTKNLILSLVLVFNSFINAQTIKVAILDFENTSGIAKYDGLGKAMSSMLITDIEANVSPKRLQLVERSQIQKILKEQNFQATSSVDKTSSVKAGKLLGVKYLLVGDIYILNDVLVINARLTDTETGDIKFSKKQEGKLVGWLNLKTNIAKDLAASIAMPFTEPNIPDKEINMATITSFGNAITAKDEGKIDKAEELVNTIKEFSPDFKYLDDLKSQLDELKKQVEKNTADIKNLNEGVSDLQNIIRGASIILNPTTPKDFIINAYLYKNAGDLLKSEVMFKKFIEITKLEKFDIYCDYLDVLESNYGKNEAKEIITSVSNNSNICKLAVTFKQNKLNIDKFDSLLLTVKFDSTLISFIQFLNSYNKYVVIANKFSGKNGFSGYVINYVIKLINWRSQFGDKYENLQKYFYLKNGPLIYACKKTDLYGTNVSIYYITMLRTLKLYVEGNWNNQPILFSNEKVNPKEYNKFSVKEIDDLIYKESNIQ